MEKFLITKKVLIVTQFLLVLSDAVLILIDIDIIAWRPWKCSFRGFQLKLFLDLPTLGAYFDEKQYELKSNRDVFDRNSFEIRIKTREIISLPI